MHTPPPDFFATGYHTERGAVRLWRKNSQPQKIHLKVVFNPFHGDNSETANYYWQKGNLIAIERYLAGENANTVRLRFDQQGQLNFMQRQLPDRREALTTDAVKRYILDAKRVLDISDALLNGSVKLQQGIWIGEGNVKSCQQGQIAHPALSESEIHTIVRRYNRSGSPLTVAWLQAQESAQLLLLAAGDDCQWEPKASTF